MKKIYLETPVQVNLVPLIEGFNSSLLTRLQPPLGEMTLTRYDGNSVGDEIHIEIHLMGQTVNWVSVIAEEKQSAQEYTFVDVGRELPFPLSYWHHRHTLKQVSDGRSLIIDEVEFECRPALLEWAVKPMMLWMFKSRVPIYQKYFAEKK